MPSLPSPPWIRPLLVVALSALALASPSSAQDALQRRHVYLTWDGDPTTSVVVNLHRRAAARTLIARGATWRYRDAATPAADWATPAFDDSGWARGAAPLGYGDDDLRTRLGHGGDTRDRHATCWFRHAFTLDRRPGGALTATLVADDGAGDGAWALRSAPRDGRGGDRLSIDPRLLREGRNVVAVAVHQVRPDSSDLAFDLSLEAAATAPAGPVTVQWAEGAEGALERGAARRAEGRAVPMPDLPDRAVAHVPLRGLKPATVYRFRVGSDALGWSAVRRFRTLPARPLKEAGPLRFAVGGDMGTSQAMADLLTAAAKTAPHWCIVGGDLAYANGRLELAYKWDQWLDAWCARMVTPDGLTIPMVAVIGNHEVGPRSGPPARRAPFYYPLFADGQGGKSHFAFDMGPDLRLVVLDSGHTQTWPSQTGFLTEQLKGAQDTRWRMAAYHIPLYPGHRNPVVGLPGRLFWLPVFDRYRLHAAFEHHDHTLKRTRRLKGGKVVQEGGTVYIGDGCFGKGAREAVSRWYTARALTRQHVWVVEVGAETWTARALDPKGARLDSFDASKE